MQEKVSILLVGDNPANFPDIRKIADYLGLDMLRSSTVTEALELCNEEAVALVIADADSPVLNHEELIATLRSSYDASQIPMIMAGMAGESRPADEAPLDYVPGEVSNHLLITRIRLLTEWFNQRRRIEWLETENERLDMVNKQIRKFVGNVAHDLRGPLGKIINTSEVLLSGVEPDSLRTFFTILEQTGRRGFNLVNDILDITALESGQLQLYFEKCDMAEIVRQVMEELSYLADKKELTLNNQIVDTVLVRGDRRRLYQILGNLVNNAIKFTEQGGSITLKAKTQQNGLWVCVEDTGIGIPWDKQARLFQKHIKISTPGTDGEKGTGFGLPLAQEIALAHEARIEVTSREGEGSKFSFILPLWKEENKPALEP